MIVSGLDEPIQVFVGQLLHGRRSIQGWVPSDLNTRKDAINFSLLTDIHPIIETYPLEQVKEAYEKMMKAKTRFRAVLVI